MIRRVLENVPNIGYSVSFTTRPPRKGEVNGADYQFVGRPEFEKLINEGEFLEFAEVHGNLYGTSLTRTEQMIGAGRDVILEIDVQGAESVKRKVPEAVSVFILPPSFAVLKKRLESRATEDAEDLRLRLKNSLSEVERYKEFDYVVINDEVERASRELGSVILAERAKRARREESIKEVIKTFENQN